LKGALLLAHLRLGHISQWQLGEALKGAALATNETMSGAG
jgi:hypothetical protein